MNSQAWRLVKIARRVAKSDPLLGYELEQNVRSYVALINPGAQSGKQKLESTVTVLKSLRQELEDIIKKMDSDEDAAEFAKFFDDEGAAEEEELRRLLKDIRSASTKLAGPKEWLKKLFSPSKGKSKPADEDVNMSPSYDMGDSAVDDFVEGKSDWKDSSHYVQEESNENAEFGKQVKSILDGVEKARKEPSMSAVEKLIDQISKAVDFGERLLKGNYKHQEGPSDSKSVSDKVKDIDDSEPTKPEEPKAPESKDSKLTPDMKKSIDQYVDAIQKSKGDEKKTIQYLQELFDEVKPALEYQSVFASAVSASGLSASQLVRFAHANPALRPALLPVLKAFRK